MNQNDMDRHYWRTGQHWSGEFRSTRQWEPRRHPPRMVWWLIIALVVTIGMLIRLNA